MTGTKSQPREMHVASALYFTFFFPPHIRETMERRVPPKICSAVQRNEQCSMMKLRNLELEEFEKGMIVGMEFRGTTRSCDFDNTKRCLAYVPPLLSS